MIIDPKERALLARMRRKPAHDRRVLTVRRSLASIGRVIVRKFVDPKDRVLRIRHAEAAVTDQKVVILPCFHLAASRVEGKPVKPDGISPRGGNRSVPGNTSSP